MAVTGLKKKQSNYLIMSQLQSIDDYFTEMK